MTPPHLSLSLSHSSIVKFWLNKLFVICTRGEFGWFRENRGGAIRDGKTGSRRCPRSFCAFCADDECRSTLSSATLLTMELSDTDELTCHNFEAILLPFSIDFHSEFDAFTTIRNYKMARISADIQFSVHSGTGQGHAAQQQPRNTKNHAANLFISINANYIQWLLWSFCAE